MNNFLKIIFNSKILNYRNKKIIIYCIITLLFLNLLFGFQPAIAKEIQPLGYQVKTGLMKVGWFIGFRTEKGVKLSSVEIIGSYIKAILSLIGILLVVLLMYGGFVWMTAAGNEEKVTKAKQILVSAIIGVFVIFCSLIITNMIINAIEDAITYGFIAGEVEDL